MRWPKKSRSLRRVARKTPGGRVVMHLKPRKHKKAHCATCKRTLHGVKEKGAKSEKRTARLYGGYLCSACTQRTIIQSVRV